MRLTMGLPLMLNDVFAKIANPLHTKRRTMVASCPDVADRCDAACRESHDTSFAWRAARFLHSVGTCKLHAAVLRLRQLCIRILTECQMSAKTAAQLVPQHTRAAQQAACDVQHKRAAQNVRHGIMCDTGARVHVGTLSCATCTMQRTTNAHRSACTASSSAWTHGSSAAETVWTRPVLSKWHTCRIPRRYLGGAYSSTKSARRAYRGEAGGEAGVHLRRE